MRSRTRLLLVAAAVVVALVAIVLWRGRDAGGTEVTHAELVQQANAICAQLARRNGALEAAPRPYDSQSVDFFTAIGDNVRTAKSALAELSPPGADADAFDRLVGVYDDIESAMDKIQAAAAVEQDQEIVTVLDEISELTRQAVESERALGICPGATSANVAIAVNLRRTRPNPLTETGTLD